MNEYDGICMEYVWNMNGTYTNTHGICLEFVGIRHGTYIDYVWNMDAIWMGPNWNMHGIYKNKFITKGEPKSTKMDLIVSWKP